MIDEIKVKESFQKIRQEMDFLAREIIAIRAQLEQVYTFIVQSNTSSRPTTTLQQNMKTPADNHQYNNELSPNFQSSIGNDGVPADSQQTVNRHSSTLKRTFEGIHDVPELNDSKEGREIKKISSVINTLKKDLKDKFKSLTKQEFLIFSLLYSMTEETDQVAYKDLAVRAKLTESSIRDYITRLEHKGIPIIKEKINNKQVILKIPRELKDLATLDNLTKLKQY
jgi:predicted transcriptional regulator